MKVKLKSLWQKEENNDYCSFSCSGGIYRAREKLEKLGATCIELRKAEDLKQHYDGLVLPGGESTVQGKLLKELGMYDTLKSQIESGMPVLATCAGMILLAKKNRRWRSGTFADYACDCKA